MTNPNNAIGTNGAYGGRTSVNAFNDDLAVYVSRGVLSGFAVSPDTGMKVALGGNGTTRDVAVAEDNSGNRTSINNISTAPIILTIPGAPASNSRIDLIVAYVANPPQGSSTITDNYGACGLIVVSGAAAATPVRPDDSDIRTAITADGASGSTAYYVVLGSVLVSSGTTDITGNMITQGAKATLNTTANIEDGSITTAKIADSAITTGKINNGAITTGKLANNSVTAAKLDRTNIDNGNTTSDIRIGTFAGKPLYRRVQAFSNLPRGYTGHNWDRTFPNNLQAFVRLDGMMYDGSTNYVDINSAPPDNVGPYGISIRDINTTTWASVLGTAMSETNSGYFIIDYITSS